MRTPLLALAIAAALPACGLDELDNFDMPVEGQFELPGSPIGSVPLVDAIPFPGLTSQQFKQAFENNDASVNDVESVKLASMKLRVLEPDGGNLDFADRITFFIEAPGLERRQIAETAPVPAGSRIISLDVTKVELKPYVTADAMTVVMELAGTMPTVDTTLQAEAVFAIDLGVL